MSTPSQHFSNGKALLRMRSTSCLLFTVVIIAATIWNNSVVYGAPAKLDLEEYDFAIEYIRGKENYAADALSRIEFSDIQNSDINTIFRVTTRLQSRKGREKLDDKVTVTELVTSDDVRVYEAINASEYSKMPRLYIAKDKFFIRRGKTIIYSGKLTDHIINGIIDLDRFLPHDALAETPFNLQLQPPVFEASFSGDDGDTKKTLDSYGNPIESLKPIKTPDGRKVVSAQGLQFEIPNYASGITELQKPSDDLLPPFVDPIAVAVPNDSSESSFTTVAGHATSLASDVDAAGIFKGLPEYIVQLNDPDIGGPVEYMPTDDNNGLSIIAWDLLPPTNADPAVINAPSKQRINAASTTSQSIYSHASTVTDQQHTKTSQTTPSPLEVITESATKYTRTQQSNRGNVHYTTSTSTSTTPRSTTMKTTTTTKRPTTTTTTRKTITTRTTTTKAPTTTTTPQPDSSEFFKLEAGDSYTLPSWLADIDDPDLDVAVTYIVPEDIHEYNHTISRDLLPPLEPYTDLNAVNLTPPPSFDDSKPVKLTTTTPKTSTTIRTTTTTTPRSTTSTTRRPTVASSQPHWVRAKVTSAPSVRPTSTFSSQFTPSSQTFNSPTFTTASAGNTNLAQRTTTTIIVKPKTTTSPFNRPLSNTDKISSEEITQTDKQRQQNPFLSGSYKPQPFSKPSTTTTRRTTTSTTTTTTTTTRTPKVDANPFEPTIPPWLRDFDYADVGPGVPFVYDPNDDESPVDEDILPPSQTNAVLDATATKATSTFVNSPTTATSFLNSQNQNSFLNKFSSTATSLTSSPSIPSKVTLPLPSIDLSQDDNSVTQPHTVFVPPTPTPPADDTNTSKKTSSSFNTNFPARFEPSPTPIATDNPNKVPLSADRESFPPFNTSPNTLGVSIPTKTTFSKSEDGKVITNNIFLNGGATQATTTKTYGSTVLPNTQQKDTFGSSATGFNKATTVSSSFNQFSTSSGASGFVAASSSEASSDGTKYTGRFGGPPGVLAPNSKPVGFATASTPQHVTQSFQKPSPIAPATAAGANKSNSAHKFTGSFGGPPGVLRPYDNVQSG